MNKLTTVLAAAILGTSAFAVIASPDDGDRESRHQERMERRMQHMTEYLGLSNDQQDKIKSMYDQDKEERKARREVMHQQLESVLTSEQREKWQKHREERQAKRCDRFKEREGREERHDDRGRHHRES